MKARRLTPVLVLVVIAALLMPVSGHAQEGGIDDATEQEILSVLNHSDELDFTSISDLGYTESDGHANTLTITAQGTDGNTYVIELNSPEDRTDQAVEEYPAEYSMGGYGGTGLAPTFVAAWMQSHPGESLPPGGLNAAAQSAQWLVYTQDTFGGGTGSGTPAAPSTSQPPTVTPDMPTLTPGRPTPTSIPTITPGPTPIECPAPTVSQHSPTTELLYSEPPFPVVVGQGGSGLEIVVRITSYPAIYRWWTREVEREEQCIWHGDSVTGEPDESYCDCIPNNPDASGCWPGWAMEEVETREYCQEHSLAIPDPIVLSWCGGSAVLREASREWIETNLASKYPGARVHHPEWSVGCMGSPILTADKRYVLDATVRFPFEDPGWYDVAMSGRTQGTQFTPPRSFGWAPSEPQPVYLLDTSLLPSHP